MPHPNFVVITRAKSLNYLRDYVSLPKSYGTPAYYEREDIQEIMAAVKENLRELDNRSHFLESLRNKPVLIKPNLVAVFHQFGFKDEDYPESTDPRVIDAIVEFIKPYAKEILIVESSGRGVPTRASFKIAGYDRLAKHHNIRLVPLEEQPVRRYILPKARVMKEIIVPALFHDVITGNAFYISVPKLKTNLYTGVTLGFKNAMGLIPYNLRQRNHNYRINEKLVDMFYLFKPNLVVIDGIVGGEGNTPAPVDPVDSQVIISGTNSVETDRVATRIMAHDPDAIKLISHATQLGFGDPSVQIIGEEPRIPFRPAIRDLFSVAFRDQYPNVKVFIGHSLNNAPHFDSPSQLDALSNQELFRISTACDGGCVPAIITAFEYIRYMGHSTDFSLNLFIGSGIKIGQEIYFVDHTGKKYTISMLQHLPGKSLAMGSCTQFAQSFASIYIDGCMPKPTDSIFALFKLLKLPNLVLKPFKNKQLGRYLVALLKTWRIRTKLIRKGIWLDCPLDPRDTLFEPRTLSEIEKTQDIIEWPFPPMSAQQKKEFLKLERPEF